MDTNIQLIKNSNTFKLIIPKEVENIIRYLCSKVHNIEWSGILFYTYEGSMDEGNLVITCKDIYVMDIGNSSYTEFNMSPEVVSYMASKPELIGTQCGLAHSHHVMSTFFSGTDTDTLKEEGIDRNHFVSLIVNNAGTYTAAITRKIHTQDTIQRNYSYRSFNDTIVNKEDTCVEEKDIIEYFMLDIIKEGSNQSYNELDSRLSEIRKQKEETKEKFNKGAYQSPLKTDVSYTIPRYKEPSLFDFPNKKEKSNINPKDVTHILLQLLTGSIIIRDTTKIDINKWINSMVTLFDERFGNTDSGLSNYEMWADGFLEFILSDKTPITLSAEDEKLWFSDLAEELLERLDKFKENKYIIVLKQLLEQWIMP